MAQTIFHAADSRGSADHGWLQAKFSFSFAGYQDRARVHFGALRVLNDAIIGVEVGFGEHPHDNMEIISVVLEGALSHKDTMGNVASIQPNEVQVMSAGTGLQHSEFNDSKTQPINSLQIWIFPKERDIKPRYAQKFFDPTARINKLQALAAPSDQAGDALPLNQDAWIHRVTLETGKDLAYTMHATGNGVYIFVLDGAVTVAEQALGKRDALGIWDTKDFTLQPSKDSDVLLIEVPMEF